MTSLRKSPNLRLAIVLLAAGEGSRMGSVPKALLQKNGKTLLEGFCTAVKALHPVEFIVITGFHAAPIEQELSRLAKLMDLSITIIHNQNASSGQASSVRLALESLGNSFDVVAMCLSDQPQIGEDQLITLLNQFADRELHQDVVMPMVGAQRGNPTLFSKKAIEEMLEIPGMVCRLFMDKNPNRIKTFHSDNDAYILDVDTDADIQKLGVTRT
ncbi:NTP transferase domain-containing protein [Polynucleobacter sp. MWH-UH25E]|uniref:nucleotidyltransferase family protein n=1 Tax=Polynucleobacter sp. MWH-UH25E TaxID=1855616 RepID=UPI001BFDA2E1|nr:nucleotidyltransferase family protein [Polynucleobacter sp. MWH-UH25E]QWD61627.1 nucleotidyltransferase family protein [Polynucleobacter sp. MWH-UH25E]